MVTGIKVDGVNYNNVHVVSLQRNAEVLDGPNATRNTAGGMVRDILGTFYNYSVEIDSDEASVSEYDSLYEVLSSPEDSHLIVMPYGQSTLTFMAYVTKVADELLYVTDSEQRWGSMSFSFIAMRPQRT